MSSFKREVAERTHHSLEYLAGEQKFHVMCRGYGIISPFGSFESFHDSSPIRMANWRSKTGRNMFGCAA